MKIYDEHVHLRAHSDEPEAHNLRPFLQVAQKRQIAISIKEHGPLPKKYQRGPRGDFYFAMAPEELVPFLDQFIDTAVPVGLELDYFADAEDEVREIAGNFLAQAQQRRLKIGALNGSVHLLPLDLNSDTDDPDIVMWDDKEESFAKYCDLCGIDRIIEEYHKALCGLVKMQLFDVVSHVDLLRKFDRIDVHGKSFYLNGHETFYQEAIFDVLQQAGENGIAVELNTQGIDRPYGRPFLTPQAIKFCREKKIRLTFASDAHKPETIGRHFAIAGEMFAAAGVEKLTCFRERKPHFYDFR